jgi:hypothetical protein
VDYDIHPGKLSNLINIDFLGLEAKVAGWGESNDGLVLPNLLTGKLKVLPIFECENRIETIQGFKTNFHAGVLCTASYPFILLNEVSMIYLLIQAEI